MFKSSTFNTSVCLKSIPSKYVFSIGADHGSKIYTKEKSELKRRLTGTGNTILCHLYLHVLQVDFHLTGVHRIEKEKMHIHTV